MNDIFNDSASIPLRPWGAIKCSEVVTISLAASANQQNLSNNPPVPSSFSSDEYQDCVYVYEEMHGGNVYFAAVGWDECRSIFANAGISLKQMKERTRKNFMVNPVRAKQLDPLFECNKGLT